MKKGIGYFKFRFEWMDFVMVLPAQVRAEVYEAVIEYAKSGTLPQLKATADMAFRIIQRDIDDDNSKAKEVSRVRSEAGKKHKGNQYWNKMEQNGTNETNVPTENQQPQKGIETIADLSGTNGTNVPPQVSTPNINNNIINIQDNNNNNKAKTKDNTTIDKRKTDFYNSLVPYVEKYGKDMIREFFDYWSEMNRSQTKMRFEQQPTWEIGKRLATWASREKVNDKNKTGMNVGVILKERPKYTKGW